MDDSVRFAAQVGLKPQEFYSMSSREFELYAEGFFMNREWQMEAMAWMQANLIQPHIKGKISASQIYKRKPIAASQEELEEELEVESIQKEIDMVERRLRMTKNSISDEDRQKLNDKIDRLFESLQTAGEERDMNKAYLESAEHLRSVSFLDD